MRRSPNVIPSASEPFNVAERYGGGSHWRSAWLPLGAVVARVRPPLGSPRRFPDAAQPSSSLCPTVSLAGAATVEGTSSASILAASCADFAAGKASGSAGVASVFPPRSPRSIKRPTAPASPSPTRPARATTAPPMFRASRGRAPPRSRSTSSTRVRGHGDRAGRRRCVRHDHLHGSSERGGSHGLGDVYLCLCRSGVVG